jgi:hypothetical protein
MSGKYAFSQTLKEVRFLFCQTGEKSAGARFVALFPYYPSRGNYCYAWNWKGASCDSEKCKANRLYCTEHSLHAHTQQ